MSFRANRDSGEGCGCAVVIAIIMLVVIGGAYFAYSATSNMITEGKAVARFENIAGTDNIQVERKTNNWIIVGDPYDVTFELVINGKKAGGRCVAGYFSVMVCRIYDSKSGD